MGRRLGLLIGIDQYLDSAFRPLQYAEADSSILAQWLANSRGGNWNPSDMQVVRGAQATTEWIESLLAQLCVHSAEPDDLVLIYFAGHAFIDEARGDGYLACANTIYQQPATGIHLLSMVREALVPSRAAQIILLLDCFQTGAAWNRRRASPFDFQPLLGQTLMQGLQQTRGRLVYCSCRGNDLAPEVGEKNLGNLMYRAILGLSGLSKEPATGQISLQKLHAYFNSTLGPQHVPQIFGQEPRPIVLVGEMPTFAQVAPAGQNVYAASPVMPPAPPSSPITFQGIVESGPLVGPLSQASGAAATGQLSPSTSGQISLELVEQNRQQQCMKLIQQARQSVQMQNLPEALNIVDQVLQIAPTFIDALTLKGQALGAMGRFQEAIQIVEQLLQVDPNNALAWSMRAALLTNTGRPQEALEAIERSIALDPHNPETQTIRDTIHANLANSPYMGQHQKFPATSGGVPGRDSAVGFLMNAGLQILAFIIGIAGAFILVLQPHIPIIVAFLLESIGLATLCVTAARGAYLYGLGRLLFTIVLCLLAGGILGALYKFGYNWLVLKVEAFPPLIVPVLFLGFWLIAAAVAPLLVGLGGFIGGLALGVRRRR